MLKELAYASRTCEECLLGVGVESALQGKQAVAPACPRPHSALRGHGRCHAHRRRPEFHQSSVRPKGVRERGGCWDETGTNEHRRKTHPTPHGCALGIVLLGVRRSRVNTRKFGLHSAARRTQVRPRPSDPGVVT